MKFLTGLIAFSLSISAQADFSVPKLDFQYADIFDISCADKSNFPIKPETAAAAEAATPHYQKFWDASGPDLLRKLFEFVGRGYYRSELTVSTTVCNYPPMSEPLMMNVGYFLDTKSERTGRHIVQMTFHEFIHKYIVANVKWENLASLNGEFGNENESVKTHLHLMALEKTIYQMLGREDLVKTAEVSYKEYIKGPYKRTWELVSVDDTRKKLVEELKANLK